MTPWDPEAGIFAALNHRDLLAYLRSQGWQIAETLADRALVLSRPEGGEAELVIPARATFGAYAARMADAVAALARLEDRSPNAILADVQAAGVDVIRLRAPVAAEATSSLPIIDGVALIEAGRDLLLSAACAATGPLPRYHLGKNPEANAYLRTVRLGQTERGSYVLTLLSPVDPAMGTPGILPGLGLDPFARQVTRQLGEALSGLRHALVAQETYGFRAFEDAVWEGVSANFCAAAASLIEHGNGLEVRISWARTRPGPADCTTPIRFSAADAPTLRSAVQTFQARAPEPDQELVGYVIRAARPPGDFDGQVALETLVDGRRRQVRMRFEEADFAAALRALEARIPVAVVGDLIRNGARLELRQPRQLRVLDRLDGPDDDAAA